MQAYLLCYSLLPYYGTRIYLFWALAYQRVARFSGTGTSNCIPGIKMKRLVNTGIQGVFS